EYFDTNLTLLKNTRITERINLQFRAEAYNLFNRIQFDNPGTASNTLASPGTFGQSLQTLTQPDGTTSARQLQIAMKLIFYRIVRSSALTPFQTIWTPIHNRMNEDKRRMTFIAVSPSARASDSAKR